MHMITFLCPEANDNVIAPVEFHKLIFIGEPESKMTTEAQMGIMEDKVQAFLDKSVNEDGRLARLTPFKARAPANAADAPKGSDARKGDDDSDRNGAGTIGKKRKRENVRQGGRRNLGTRRGN